MVGDTPEWERHERESVAQYSSPQHSPAQRRRPFPQAFFDLVARETGNRQFYRPVHSVHKWWARRPGSLFRGLLLRSFLGEAHDAWSRHYASVDIPGETGNDPVILDPFMGGGTTLIESVRLGLRSVGADLNPVAWWTVRQELSMVDIAELRGAFSRVEQTCADDIRQLYETTCECGRRVVGQYFFWVTQVDCEKCGEPVPLFRSYRLATAHRDGEQVVHCPECGTVFATTERDDVTCPNCNLAFAPGSGTANRAHYRCQCGHRGRIVDAVRGRTRPPHRRLFAVEYACPEHGRRYKRADASDRERARDLERQAEEWAEQLFAPHQAVPAGYNAAQMQRYGYRHFRDLFSGRQLIALDLLARAILGLDRGPARELLITLFSDILDYNCMLCGYNQRNRQITNMFSHHAFIPQKQPVENNAWGGNTFGGGTFSGYFEKLVRAKEYNIEVFEKRPTDAGLEDVLLPGERIDARLVDTFERLECRDQRGGKYPVPVLLLNGSSESLPLPNHSIDAVVTDPPYFDNVMYGELAEFYYVWLRLFLGDDYPEFQPFRTDRSREAVKDPSGPRRAGHFREVLEQVFRECHRVLKPGGPFICTFHHGTPEAWITLALAALRAGFVLVDYFPVQSEMDSSVHIMRRGGLVNDAVLTWMRQEDVDGAAAAVPGAPGAMPERPGGEPGEGGEGLGMTRVQAREGGIPRQFLEALRWGRLPVGYRGGSFMLRDLPAATAFERLHRLWNATMSDEGQGVESPE